MHVTRIIKCTSRATKQYAVNPNTPNGGVSHTGRLGYLLCHHFGRGWVCCTLLPQHFVWTREEKKRKNVHLIFQEKSNTLLMVNENKTRDGSPGVMDEACSYLLASSPPGGRLGMLSDANVRITCTKSGTPSSPCFLIISVGVGTGTKGRINNRSITTEKYIMNTLIFRDHVNSLGRYNMWLNWA